MLFEIIQIAVPVLGIGYGGYKAVTSDSSKWATHKAVPQTPTVTNKSEPKISDTIKLIIETIRSNPEKWAYSRDPRGNYDSYISTSLKSKSYGITISVANYDSGSSGSTYVTLKVKEKNSFVTMSTTVTEDTALVKAINAFNKRELEEKQRNIRQTVARNILGEIEKEERTFCVSDSDNKSARFEGQTTMQCFITHSNAVGSTFYTPTPSPTGRTF